MRQRFVFTCFRESKHQYFRLKEFIIYKKLKKKPGRISLTKNNLNVKNSLRVLIVCEGIEGATSDETDAVKLANNV